MKVYISADIEGITGITHWDETEKKMPDYEAFRKQMTKEVYAACMGAKEAGADEIWVKDAHDSGRNILTDELPEGVKVLRGWSGHPFLMVEGLDDFFDALVMIGYHSYAGSGGNPLSHTLNPKDVNYIKLNDMWASEFLIYAYAGASVGVPLVFLSGDDLLCKEVNRINKHIITLPVNKGMGNAVLSIHPKEAIEKIRKGVKEALTQDLKKYKIDMPSYFRLEISYKDHTKAYKAGFYPGAKSVSPTNIVFETDNYFEVLRMLLFVT